MKKKRKKIYYYREKERLEREIERKKAQLAALDAQHLDESSRFAAEAASNRRRLSSDTVLQYYYGLFRENRLYVIWERVLSIFRRFRLISLIFKVLNTMVAILGTGAFFLVLASLLLISLPVSTIILFFCHIRALIIRRQAVRSLSGKIMNSPLTVIFMPRASSDSATGDFVLQTAALLSEQGQMVFIILPLFSKLCVGRNHGGIYKISRTDYFYLKKSLFPLATPITHIYI